ncbi:MAG: hypothetical protein EBX50_06040 [Chitinophagia bacterium]|nr:hypothetical protein [Chitinophagia bacterium]
MQTARLRKIVIFCCLIFCGSWLFISPLNAQTITISGTVFDISARRPLEAVAVISSSGKGTVTDSMGRYTISVNEKDSIWFSLIGKSTMKYPVDTISNTDR